MYIIDSVSTAGHWIAWILAIVSMAECQHSDHGLPLRIDSSSVGWLVQLGLATTGCTGNKRERSSQMEPPDEGRERPSHHLATEQRYSADPQTPCPPSSRDA